jgi:hypothetical protein
MDRKSVGPLLRRAVRQIALVQVGRRCDSRSLPGYAVGIGEEWLLLHVVDPDPMLLNGYSAVRLRDVRHAALLAVEDNGFMDKALRARGERPRPQPRVSLRSARTVMETAARRFALVTIHEENKNSEVCWIGQPVGFQRASVELQEVTPAGRWSTRTGRYQLRSITKIDFGGGYESALAAAAGAQVRKSVPASQKP